MFFRLVSSERTKSQVLWSLLWRTFVCLFNLFNFNLFNMPAGLCQRKFHFHTPKYLYNKQAWVNFEKFTCGYLFKITQGKSCNHVILWITCLKKQLQQQHFDSKCTFFTSFIWFTETNFVCQAFTTPTLSNHSVKNLGMCDDWCYTIKTFYSKLRLQ